MPPIHLILFKAGRSGTNILISLYLIKVLRKSWLLPIPSQFNVRTDMHELHTQTYWHTLRSSPWTMSTQNISNKDTSPSLLPPWLGPAQIRDSGWRDRLTIVWRVNTKMELYPVHHYFIESKYIDYVDILTCIIMKDNGSSCSHTTFFCK